MIEKEHVLKILKESSEALRNGDAVALKDLSNQTVHSASTAQDAQSIGIAVIIYALGKIIEREDYRKEKGWTEFYTNSVKAIDLAVVSLEKNDLVGTRENLRKVRDEIQKLSGKLKIYIEDVFRKAKINKASKIYAHGPSLEKTAKLLGVTLWELASYAGQKAVSEDEPESKTMRAKDRIKLIEDIFREGKEKVIIFDASTLISFAMNGLLLELERLKKEFGGRFMIPCEVKCEIVDKPLTIKRFELQALKLKNLLDTSILEMPTVLDINEKEISLQTKVLMEKANTMFISKKQNVRLIDLGETACLALSKMLSERDIANVLAVDERTTRVLCENPKNLKDLMQRKLHSKVELRQQNFKDFKGCKFIRSTELAYMTHKKGLMRLQGDGRILDALLWALKSTGCAIQVDEIDEIKQIAKSGSMNHVRNRFS